MDYLLLTCFIISFFTTFILTPVWIRTAKNAGIVGGDMNKYSKPKVAELGGVPVVAGFMAGVLWYIGLKTFYFQDQRFLELILAAVTTLLGITIIGILDDILGWKKGLKQWQKPLLTLPIVMPMMAVNAGQAKMVLPFLGSIDFGILYPLLLVPLGIAGAANGFNMLAGFNGLEAGLGVIILSVLGMISWQTGNSWVTMLAFAMVFSLLAFLRYNKFPAKVFPGDALTYGVGTLIGCVAILGNMEKVALVLFIPYFLELILKARGRFRAENFGIPKKNGTLAAPYDGNYSFIHLVISLLNRISQATETKVVLVLLSIEFIVALYAYIFIFQ